MNNKEYFCIKFMFYTEKNEKLDKNIIKSCNAFVYVLRL